MSFFKKYKLSFMILLVFVMIATPLFLTNLPAEGSLSKNIPEQTAFRFGYMLDKPDQVNMKEWLDINKSIPFIAGADRLFDKKSTVPLSNFYPVFDGSSSLEQFNAVYPHLPSDAIENFGRSIYTVDYVNTRFLFLHDKAILDSNLTVLNWVQQTVKTNKQPHSVVFINKAPVSQPFWDTMRNLNVNLVITEDEVFAPANLIVQEPSDLGLGQHPDWKVWRPAKQFTDTQMLLIEGQGERLRVKVVDRQGHPLDQLEEDVTQFELNANENMPTLVGMKSVWRYHPGGNDVHITVPEGYDITGENPITKRLTVPPEDWRSSQYNDSGWSLGQAPLGHTKNNDMKRIINKTLPVIAESPTYYFRKSFVINEDPNQFTKLLLHITYEDGYVVYLNGEEVSLDGIRTGLLTHSSLAFHNEPAIYQSKDLTNHIPKLVKGTNVIAVEVHRSHPNSPNMLFDLSLSYEKQ